MNLRNVLLLVLSTFLGACQISHRVKKDEWPKPLLEIQFFLHDDHNERYSLTELMKGYDGLVVWFWQIKCPCVARYQERFDDLKRRYPSVSFILVDSHSWDTREAIEEVRARRKIHEPIFKDEYGTLRDALLIKGTPSTALINQHMQVLYLGWPDNERPLNEQHRMPYLDNALKQFVQKEPITQSSSTMFGCPLQ